jgi:hypothetical protein
MGKATLQIIVLCMATSSSIGAVQITSVFRQVRAEWGLDGHFPDSRPDVIMTTSAMGSWSETAWQGSGPNYSDTESFQSSFVSHDLIEFAGRSHATLGAPSMTDQYSAALSQLIVSFVVSEPTNIHLYGRTNEGIGYVRGPATPIGEPGVWLYRENSLLFTYFYPYAAWQQDLLLAPGNYSLQVGSSFTFFARPTGGGEINTFTDFTMQVVPSPASVAVLGGMVSLRMGRHRKPDRAGKILPIR